MTSQQRERIHNFSAGPAVLPVEVLEVVKSNLTNFENSGIGIMEMSHRSDLFQSIIEEAEQTLRNLLSIDKNYAVLFAVGGASLQFSMVPMNLQQQDMQANYILSGTWSKKAAAEAKRFTSVHIAASSEEDGFKSLPKDIVLSENPSYVHYTSNNTIVGTQYREEPKAEGTPLICDASSDFLHRKINIEKYGLIYAGAQKNIGTAGVTVLIVRKDLLKRSSPDLPTMCNYNTFVDSSSLYNTPPTFAIYVVREILRWIEGLGGLEAIEKRNQEKAAVLYNKIDSSEFYTGFSEPEVRSLMNITFRLATEELENTFIQQANNSGFSGLKGHRSVGGIRASTYNALPIEGVKALVEFMNEFESKFG